MESQSASGVNCYLNIARIVREYFFGGGTGKLLYKRLTIVVKCICLMLVLHAHKLLIYEKLSLKKLGS